MDNQITLTNRDLELLVESVAFYQEQLSHALKMDDGSYLEQIRFKLAQLPELLEKVTRMHESTK